jgi:type IV pilus assembly protein PilY1
VQVLDTKYSSAAGGAYDYVLVGTGNRAHPLNTTVDNRFYAFRDTTVSTMADSDGNHLADSYPQQVSGVTTPIGNSDLVDVTSQVLDSSSATDRSSLGWYYDFNSAGSTGEKVLSAPLTLAGTVFFSSYLPDATNSTDLCDTQIGGGDAYNFNILNAKAALDWDLSGTVDPIKDRVKSLGGGIPSDVVPVFTNQGIVGIVGIEGGAAQLGTLSGLPRYRTYWYKETPQS